MLEAIGTVKEYLFVSAQPGTQLYDMHRLVHLATRAWLKRQSLLAGVSRKVCVRLAAVSPRGRSQEMSMWRMYMPHALHFLRAEDCEPDVFDQATLQSSCGQCLLLDGRAAEAEPLFMEVLML
jgi:hypothetical protein